MNTSLYTILVVDDESSATELMGRLLRGVGYRVLTTQSPLEAITILSKQPIDILISDIEMPGINGLELVDLARREFPGVMRILLTGHSSTKSMLRAINEGQVFRYLQKPCDNNKVIETIEEATKQLVTLRQSAEHSRQQQQQQRIKNELEEEHPGIHQVTLKNGVYIIGLSLSRAQQLEHPLASLLQP